MNNNFEVIIKTILVAIACTPIFFFAALVVKFQKRRLAGRSEEAVVDDPEALAKAEAVANAIDFRVEILKSHSLYDNFSTMQGYNMNYMDKLIAYLGENGVVADYRFQEAMPAGVLTVTGATGTYELYVQRGQESAARDVIQRFRELG